MSARAVAADDADAPTSSFEVHLDVFTGPFDLLLGLIAKHRLDVTEVALAAVTDEFVAHIRAMGDGWDLDEVSGFVLVAATLLDLKAARLLPGAQVEDEQDLALLEARDLLFARLLQYRAFRTAAADIESRLDALAGRQPRRRGDDPAAAGLLPELVWRSDPEAFARLAAEALAPRPVPTVGLEHLHAPEVSVAEQRLELLQRLHGGGAVSFARLVADAGGRAVVVARFLAVLELYREDLVHLAQDGPMAELSVRLSRPEDRLRDEPHQPDPISDPEQPDPEETA
ncbi:segregation and condensation protein A [Aquipuribacter hungaricus]|uniref:Segregation and condensation protein A n=1 Tax=Aquipuribacter hungaricus TaxID=545624 RepID=A0ABV7WE46_9MICO